MVVKARTAFRRETLCILLGKCGMYALSTVHLLPEDGWFWQNLLYCRAYHDVDQLVLWFGVAAHSTVNVVMLCLSFLAPSWCQFWGPKIVPRDLFHLIPLHMLVQSRSRPSCVPNVLMEPSELFIWQQKVRMC